MARGCESAETLTEAERGSGSGGGLLLLPCQAVVTPAVTSKDFAERPAIVPLGQCARSCNLTDSAFIMASMIWFLWMRCHYVEKSSADNSHNNIGIVAMEVMMMIMMTIHLFIKFSYSYTSKSLGKHV